MDLKKEMMIRDKLNMFYVRISDLMTIKSDRSGQYSLPDNGLSFEEFVKAVEDRMDINSEQIDISNRVLQSILDGYDVEKEDDEKLVLNPSEINKENLIALTRRCCSEILSDQGLSQDEVSMSPEEIFRTYLGNHLSIYEIPLKDMESFLVGSIREGMGISLRQIKEETIEKNNSNIIKPE